MSTFEPLTLVEGYILAQAVDFLHREGIFGRLAQAPETAEALAAARGLDGEIVGQVLEFARHRGDGLLARAEDGRYRLLLDPARLFVLSHMLDKYLGGYGACLGNLSRTARAPAEAGALIDAERFATAFAMVRRASFPALPPLMRRFGVSRLLDVGCGAGGLLLEMAQGDPRFAGWGVDPNPHSVAVARQRAEELGLSQRLRFMEGNALTLAEALPAGLADAVEAISGASLLNEFFHNGPARAVDLLRSLRGLFPGRLLFAADYYGRLGHVAEASPGMLHALVHDFAQAASGQGVPPPSGEAWDAVYRAAGCERLERMTGAHNGIDWFIDTLRLVPH